MFFLREDSSLASWSPLIMYFKSLGWSLLVLVSYRSASQTHHLQVSCCVRLQRSLHPTISRKLEEFVQFKLPMRPLLTVGHATCSSFCWNGVAGLAIFKSLHSCHIDMCTYSFYMFMLYSRYTSIPRWCFAIDCQKSTTPLQILLVFFASGPFGGLRRVQKNIKQRPPERLHCTVWVSWEHCALMWCAYPRQRVRTSVRTPLLLYEIKGCFVQPLGILPKFCDTWAVKAMSQ